MKITQFTLDNFKSFKDSNNRIYDANLINFIYGENNSGKSNILKFLKLIFAIKKNSNTIEVEGEMISQISNSFFFEGVIDSEPYIYHKNNRNEQIGFTFFIELTHDEIQKANFEFYKSIEAEYFDENKDVAMLKLEGEIKSLDSQSTSEIILKSVNLNSKDIYSNNGIDVEYFKSGEEEMQLLGNRNNFQLFLSYLNNISLYINNDRFFQKEKYEQNNIDLTPQNFKNWLYNLSINEFRYNEYLDLLNFIRSNSVDNLKILKKLDLSYSLDKSNFIEILLNNGSERLPIDSFGTGISQILYILTKLFFTNARIILIEELELNLSPKTQKELFKILKSLMDRNIIDQVFFTSHSKYFNFRNDFSIYEVAIDNNGISSISRKDGVPRPAFFNNTRLD